MPHNHDHAGHAHALPNSDAAFAIGLALNAGFVAVEVTCGLSAHSLSLLSDAGHNLSDVFGLLIAWGATHLSRSLPTKHRTYGWRRSSVLAALVNAIVLLIVVGGITVEATRRFAHPEPVATRTVMLVALAGVIVNGFSAWLFLGGRKRDLNLRGAFLHFGADTVVSAGVVLAALVIRATGRQWIDPAASLAIAAVITWGTWGLLREAINLSMDAVPEGIDPHSVEEYLSRLSGVTAVHDLHIWAMSTTEVALTVHLVMRELPSTDRFLQGVCEELRDRFGIGHATTQIECGDASCHQAAAHVV